MMRPLIPDPGGGGAIPKIGERKFYLKQFKAISKAFAMYEDPNTLMKYLTEGTAHTVLKQGFIFSLLTSSCRSLLKARMAPTDFPRTV